MRPAAAKRAQVIEREDDVLVGAGAADVVAAVRQRQIGQRRCGREGAPGGIAGVGADVEWGIAGEMDAGGGDEGDARAGNGHAQRVVGRKVVEGMPVERGVDAIADVVPLQLRKVDAAPVLHAICSFPIVGVLATPPLLGASALTAPITRRR